MIRPFFGLAPQSALELRPRIALSSAEASNSVAHHEHLEKCAYSKVQRHLPAW
jgi:hypothetical protein